jgi:hypothetical protein
MLSVQYSSLKPDLGSDRMAELEPPGERFRMESSKPSANPWMYSTLVLAIACCSLAIQLFERNLSFPSSGTYEVGFDTDMGKQEIQFHV